MCLEFCWIKEKKKKERESNQYTGHTNGQWPLPCNNLSLTYPSLSLFLYYCPLLASSTSSTAHFSRTHSSLLTPDILPLPTFTLQSSHIFQFSPKPPIFSFSSDLLQSKTLLQLELSIPHSKSLLSSFIFSSPFYQFLGLVCKLCYL